MSVRKKKKEWHRPRGRFQKLMAPGEVIGRALSMLRMAHLGLLDMGSPVEQEDRIRFGFLGMVVFGRTMIEVMKAFEPYAPREFAEWYAPWQRDLQTYPLLFFFQELRDNVVHNYGPPIGILLSANDPEAPPGSIVIHDKELPTMHLGNPIETRAMLERCRLYVAYLERMHASFVELAWPLRDAHLATHWPTPASATGD